MQSTYELLMECEQKLDQVNNIYITKKNYCLFCNTIKFNSTVGLIHYDDCILLKIRNHIT